MRAFRLLLAGFLIGSSVPASGQPVLPTEPFRLAMDFARFRGADDEHATLEVYYAFPRRGLTYSADSAGFTGAADITLIIRQADSVHHADRWLVPHTLRDTTAASGGVSLIGVYTVSLPAGEYTVRMLARDVRDPKRIDSVGLRTRVAPFGADTPLMSDLEFAASIRQAASKEGAFYKNTLDVIPNVGGIFTEQSACFFYAEAYNLLVAEDMSDLIVRMNVFDAVGKEILSRERPRKRVGESTVLVDQFPAARFKTGTYTLALSLLDSSRKVLTSTGKKFFVYNATLGVDSSLLTSSSGIPFAEYMSMDESELDREFRWSRWETMEAEKDQYEQIQGVDAKRKFLTEMWKKRGPGRRDEYLSLISYANANFNVMGREGYRTDRGRVHVIYGVPDEIERHPNELDMKPYEIWSYHSIQGGVIFVFVLRSQGGDYELVHSTHRNELHDENWDRPGITR